MRRRRFITDLRQVRETSGLTIEEAAARARVPASALAEIEGGLLAGHLAVLDAVLRIYQLPSAQAEELGELSRQASEPGWWQTAQGAVLEATRTLISFEEEADWENDFSLAVIPGLLQTREFAEAVIAASLPDATSAEVEGGVEIRLRRQRRLDELTFSTIIAEEALLRPIGGPAIMKTQLETLIEATNRPRVSVQVLGREQGAHVGMGGMFAVVGADSVEAMKAVYIEGTGWDTVREEPAVVQSYERAFTRLSRQALTPEDSRARILSVVKNFPD